MEKEAREERLVDTSYSLELLGSACVSDWRNEWAYAFNLDRCHVNSI